MRAEIWSIIGLMADASETDDSTDCSGSKLRRHVGSAHLLENFDIEMHGGCTDIFPSDLPHPSSAPFYPLVFTRAFFYRGEI